MSQYDRYRPKMTNYGGRWFRSNLEAKTAEALDALGVAWEYETRCFRDRRYVGGQYTPDFWLPDCLTYIEVTGCPDGRHMANARTFCETQGARQPVPGAGRLEEAHPALVLVTGGGKVVNPLDASARIWVAGCPECDAHLSFVDARGPAACRVCGAHDGCRYILREGLFEAGRM